MKRLNESGQGGLGVAFLSALVTIVVLGVFAGVTSSLNIAVFDVGTRGLIGLIPFILAAAFIVGISVFTFSSFAGS